MAYQFGDDALADARWLSFLDPQIVPVPVQRQLLRHGLTPALLVSGANLPLPLPEAAAENLRTRLQAVEPRTPHNGIDAAQPVQLITLLDPDYPALLRLCDDAPAALFAVGDLRVLQKPTVAMVGARRASPMGLELARVFAQALCKAGLMVASGLAIGIDAASHRGALSAGETIAVMPSGVGAVYPRRHRQLARDIANAGVVVSEFPPGMPAHKQNFHRRNRTLSGLALGTLVVEAGTPSGSLITATAAAAQGREVLAVPWSVRHPGGAGCLQLLADGATIARSPLDVVNQIIPGLSAQLLDGVTPDRSPPEGLAGRVYQSLEEQPLTVARLAVRAGLPESTCRQQLAALETEAWAVCEQGRWRLGGR